MTVEIDGTHHLRAAPRYKLFQPTELVLEGGVARAHILNISAGGALIFASNPPAPGAVLGLQCDGQTLRARVAWNKNGRFGVAFLNPLTDHYVSGLVAAQDAAVAVKAGRSPGRDASGRLRQGRQ